MRRPCSVRAIQEISRGAQEQLHSAIETQFSALQKQADELIDWTARRYTGQRQEESRLIPFITGICYAGSWTWPAASSGKNGFQQTSHRNPSGSAK